MARIRQKLAVILAICLLLAGMGTALQAAEAFSAASVPEALPRQDRLLLLDTVAKLWQLGIAGIGTEEPYNADDGLFGRIRQGKLDPNFIFAESLVLAIHFGASGQIARLAPDEVEPEQAKAQLVFKNIPPRFTMYYPLAALEETALAYFGWPLGPASPAEGVLQTEQGLYVDMGWWYGPEGPMAAVKQDTAFATLLSDYKDNDGWGMEGQVRLVAPGADSILQVRDRANFHVRVQKADTVWRIHSLIFVPQQARN